MKVIIFGATGMVGQGVLRESLLADDVEADYTRINHDMPVAAARVLARLDPGMTFVYISGAGTDPDSRTRWARVKGRTEREVVDLFPHGYAFRPGFIQPTHGSVSSTMPYRVAYKATAPLYPVLRRFFPRYLTTNDALGRAMLTAARTGFPTRIVENAALNQDVEWLGEVSAHEVLRHPDEALAVPGDAQPDPVES